MHVPVRSAVQKGQRLNKALEVIIVNDDDRTTAIGLARSAYEYSDASRVVDSHHAEKQPADQISPMPAYFLANYAIELTLKANLPRAGLTIRELGQQSMDMTCMPAIAKRRNSDCSISSTRQVTTRTQCTWSVD